MPCVLPNQEKEGGGGGGAGGSCAANYLLIFLTRLWPFHLSVFGIFFTTEDPVITGLTETLFTFWKMCLSFTFRARHSTVETEKEHYFTRYKGQSVQVEQGEGLGTTFSVLSFEGRPCTESHLLHHQLPKVGPTPPHPVRSFLSAKAEYFIVIIADFGGSLTVAGSFKCSMIICW